MDVILNSIQNDEDEDIQTLLRIEAGPLPGLPLMKFYSHSYTDSTSAGWGVFFSDAIDRGD